jgi:two-component system, NtrC family, sensor histidine kinase PilS
MQATDEVHSWFGPSLLDTDLESADQALPEIERLWRGFMTARVTLGLVLLLLQGTLYGFGQVSKLWLLVVCTGYFASALVARISFHPRRLGRTFDLQWVAVIGIDVLVFAALQFLHGSSINYTPLFALPVLLASVLGSMLLAMGTAAGVTLILLLYALRLSLQTHGDMAPHFIQAALTGAGSFVIAFLSHQLSTRLAKEEQRARRSQSAARIQQQVNDLVIESLSDGILVVDARGTAHAANPAARQLLQSDSQPLHKTPFTLSGEPAWQPLVDLTQQSFAYRGIQQADINIQHAGQGPRHIRVRTRLTATRGSGAKNLCVVFLQDQREMEARMRTEKLASMGRMSTAMAHEIRNPLAAITQANALLDEDLSDPRLKQLTGLVQQNALRLEKIVEDILDISRVHKRGQIHAQTSETLLLDESVARICQDWAQQTKSQSLLRLELATSVQAVDFAPDHLRRVLVNLLDNARRYASGQADSIQVVTQTSPRGQIALAVWSDAPPMEPSVERHLFEPFFSSESRSSGLGLFICRELCERHGAAIAFQRVQRMARGLRMEGNEFFVSLRQPQPANGNAPASKQPPSSWH